MRWPFNISASAQTITLAHPPGKTLAEGSLALKRKASSGLLVSFSTSQVSVSTVAKAILVSASICHITAAQDGDEAFMVPPTVARSFSVSVAMPNPVNVTKINAGLVQSLYVACLHRTANLGGFEFYQKRLKDGRAVLQDE